VKRKKEKTKNEKKKIKRSNTEYSMLGNLMPGVQKKVLSQMKKRPKLVVLDTYGPQNIQ
jgi:hypothetical protein